MSSQWEEIYKKSFEAKIILGADFYHLLSVMLGRLDTEQKSSSNLECAFMSSSIYYWVLFSEVFPSHLHFT